ncbi:unnamed protein product [Didymodactylos carnosus]|uniref:Uncharacterized protein n=1 Tax=Didymodactylos carnosus TaxID=1234261 RepID=A0A815VXF2_9BILA|nr:unnamed protein product [Didymodactylos carnosus]CAF4394242.1 unnamed protein product [Didymodactylos carnosus]
MDRSNTDYQQRPQQQQRRRAASNQNSNDNQQKKRNTTSVFTEKIMLPINSKQYFEKFIKSELKQYKQITIQHRPSLSIVLRASSQEIMDKIRLLVQQCISTYEQNKKESIHHPSDYNR